MIIVAGFLTVEPDQRELYLEECTHVVEEARLAAGCLEYAIAADLIDRTRVNVYERWESHADVEALRTTAPG